MTNSEEYKNFFLEVKKKIRDAQYEALKVVNTHLINLYWDLGKMIVEKQSSYSWGKSIVENLSKDLQLEFPDIRGFSARNLWNMKVFYEEYHSIEILQPLVAEISWAKHLVIMNKCKEVQEKRFYILSTKKFGWTKDVLIHQIENKSYEKYLLNQTNFDLTVSEKIKEQAKLAVKDSYTFDFLELSEQHSEKELETELVKNIRKFLLEMGTDFAFIGNQFKLTVDNKDFFIDLLLYHRVLRCLIAVELKVGDFKPEYKGKMEFYLNVLNDKVKLENENDSIGIIICKEKSRAIVEYAIKTSLHPIGVATYQISNVLPAQYEKLLPSVEKISEKVEFMNF
ncbi:MAG TPA: PDDEXK nuclease domain-containing protein [Candidatus Kapabacteria bacterium]|nr:PDDEXK nuclease domain-containing protein [Candidatus Kapabacteria bacterium]HPO64064.1 PDDEXK nuclease domain-containing protein [Candidatus Kapabacteria bacterium]